MTESRQGPRTDPLRRLGIEELRERLEMSPLFGIGAADAEDSQADICCTCKNRWPQPDPDNPTDPDD
ncbi:MAG TPA: hypothetical protein PLL30_01960 [Candidatus Krumholzibacteria bacterium]|nr:hypothetical protein [Candidatus Krumholzibacteria bacterium]HPD70531.1 hypothetical protein [Candidatus Krumholzibacteria bacterium]HRY39769.1 hypothetical protein [Candidatus Krumholzibacteria bacterium]